MTLKLTNICLIFGYHCRGSVIRFPMLYKIFFYLYNFISRYSIITRILNISGLIHICIFVISATFLAEASMNVWVTNSNGGDRLTQKASLSPSCSGASGFRVSVDRNNRFQNISGFGAALTNAAAYNLFHSPNRDQIMQDLFGPSGIGWSSFFSLSYKNTNYNVVYN